MQWGITTTVDLMRIGCMLILTTLTMHQTVFVPTEARHHCITADVAAMRYGTSKCPPRQSMYCVTNIAGDEGSTVACSVTDTE